MITEIKNVRFANCINLLLVLMSHEKRDEDFLRSRYLESGTYFDDTITFLEKIHIIKRIEYAISISDIPDRWTEYSNDRKVFEEHCREEFVKRLVLKMNRIKELSDYMKRFRLKNGMFRLVSSLEERITEADLRNLLIELEVIDYDATEDDYFLMNQVVANHFLLSPSTAISQDAFEQMLIQRQAIGEGAEHAVLEYEHSRLRDFPHLKKDIKHMAIENVRAGYDISSFEGSENTPPHTIRLIEVKAVSALSPTKFFWTMNEINTARDARSTYYLYLVPVRGKGNYGIDRMLVIRDPYIHVYSDEERWQRLPESFQFQLSMEQHQLR